MAADRGSIKASARCILLKFSENRFILVETINIFRNSRWRPPPSWILKNLHIWPKESILAGTKFGENFLIHVEVINIFRNPIWRPPPSWILENLHFWPYRSILICARSMLFLFCENCFIGAKQIMTFSKSNMGAAAMLDFGKFAFMPPGIDKG